MELSTFFDLLAPVGQDAIATAQGLHPREADFLSHYQTLSRLYPRELARGSLEIAILRAEAAKKFPTASQMYFTRAALEQASNYLISAHRAQRYQGFDRIFDLGCSIGSDSLALTEIAPTFGIDRDLLRLAMAQANLQALNLEAAFLQADLTMQLPFHKRKTSSQALFFDPARRRNHRRVFSVEDYSPPLSIIKQWITIYPALGVKISPGVKLDEVADFDAELEFVSLKGELKEAVLWFGPLKSGRRRATILPGGFTMLSDEPGVCLERLSEPLAYIYEPDPSILRAGLVRDLAVQLDAFQMDLYIAYLTAESLIETPLARVWEIETWFPFQLKRLRSYLRDRGVGRVVVKKRGSPLQPEALIRDLRLKGDDHRMVFLTHLQGRPIVLIGYSNDKIA
jgi:SAM-dependent methyltransferase